MAIFGWSSRNRFEAPVEIALIAQANLRGNLAVLPGGRILNHEIVRAGFAWWFRKYATGRHNAARSRGRSACGKTGIVGGFQSLFPWDFVGSPGKRGESRLLVLNPNLVHCSSQMRQANWLTRSVRDDRRRRHTMRSDESIEAYSLGRVIDDIEFAAIEEHLLVCHGCQDRLTDPDIYTKSIRSAFASFHVEAVEMQAVHVTSEGGTYLWATEPEQGLWTARISRCEVDGRHVFSSCSMRSSITR